MAIPKVQLDSNETAFRHWLGAAISPKESRQTPRRLLPITTQSTAQVLIMPASGSIKLIDRSGPTAPMKATPPPSIPSVQSARFIRHLWNTQHVRHTPQGRPTTRTKQCHRHHRQPPRRSSGPPPPSPSSVPLLPPTSPACEPSTYYPPKRSPPRSPLLLLLLLLLLLPPRASRGSAPGMGDRSRRRRC